MEGCIATSSWLSCVAIYHPTFYSTICAAVLAGVLATFGIIKQRQSAREKNSVDFESNYKSSKEIRDAWLTFVKLTKSGTPIASYASQYGSEETQAITMVLNEWERAANGIFHKVYDGNYLYKIYGTTVLDLYVYTRPFILERQKKKPRSYAQFCRLYLDWRIKRDIEDKSGRDKVLQELHKQLHNHHNQK